MAHTHSIEERFWNNVDIRGPKDCWPWKLSGNGKGYGRFRMGNSKKSSHRIAFFFENGHWPEPMCLHTCDNSWCCNPMHLYEGTALDNARDRKERGVYTHSAETRKKMSQSHRGKPSGRKGKKASVETIEKMRASRLGKKLSEDTKRKLSKSLEAAWTDPEKRARIVAGQRRR